jgi:hypothetical protein
MRGVVWVASVAILGQIAVCLTSVIAASTGGETTNREAGVMLIVFMLALIAIATAVVVNRPR